MDIIKKQQNYAEETVQFLKEQLIILNELAVAKQKEIEQREIERLTKENESLSSEINSLKKHLRFYEAQNGVKQIEVPKQESVKVNDSPVQTQTKAKPVTTQETPSKDKQKKEKKNNKEGKEKNKQAKPANNASDEKPVDVSRLLMKVGKIVDVKNHPDADGLYVEQVDVGEERPRTIVSGLRKDVQIESMRDRLAVFICNLKPQKMRGILSEGMIMCAVKPDEKTEIIDVPECAAIGDQVICAGYEGAADAQLNPKRKIWEQVQPILRINENGTPVYKGSPFTIPGKSGQFSAPTLKDCMIR